MAIDYLEPDNDKAIGFIQCNVIGNWTLEH